MNYILAIIAILTAQAAGIIGSVFTASSVKGWYATLIKPAWNPPSWLFGPVWTTLYTLMGIASYLIWSSYAKAADGQAKGQIKLALIIYGIQLGLNALWSILFFGLKKPGLAFAEIIVLLIFIAITTVLFWRIRPLAGALMIPYIAWVSFASYLNFALWRLN